MIALSTAALCLAAFCAYRAATAWEVYRNSRDYWPDLRDRAVAWGIAGVLCLALAVCLWEVAGP